MENPTVDGSDHPELAIEHGTLAREDAEKAMASYYGEGRRNLIATFLIVWFFSSGAAVVGFKLFGPFRFDTVVAFGVGAVCGLAAAVCLLLSGFRDFFTVRADLSSGTCEILKVRASRAIAVSLSDKWPAIALECGRCTLVLAGHWWDDVSRTELWKPPGKRTGFPASSFVLRRLTKSGRVLSVGIHGEQLDVEYADSPEPLLRSVPEQFMETYYVEESLNNLLIPRD